MILEGKLNTILKQAEQTTITFSPHQLISLIDYTCLDLQAAPHDIQTLAAQAVSHHTAAICVYPEHFDFIPASLPVTRATVINFPRGDAPLSQVFDSIENIVQKHHVDEIDYVFPYQTYMAGNTSLALSHCRSVYARCKQHHLVLKVILETGAFSSLTMLHKISHDIIHAGCDFLKTSTGKIAQGASIPAAFAILLAIKESQSSCGIKLSGGISTIEQALAYVKLCQIMLEKTGDKTWLRFGSSRLLNACMDVICPVK